jgi:outer membrane immunogenic protein
MHRMKLAILASTALGMGLGVAQAADMRAPILKAPVAVFDPWVGFYAGGNVGYSWGRISDTTISVAPFDVIEPTFFAFPGGTSSPELTPEGVLGGLQVGYVGRLAPNWLAGIEADFQWTGQKNSRSRGFAFVNTDCTFGFCSFTNNTDITAKLSWFGTVRGRAGLETNGVWVYVTGGLAYGKVSVSGTNTLTLIDIGGGGVTLSTPFGYSKTKAGYVVGGGIEGLIGTGGWRWKAEFLHIDLGSVGGASLSGVTINSARFTDEILRVGLNFRFGTP